MGGLGAISGSRMSYGAATNVAVGRCSMSGLDGCIAGPVRGARGETGREVSVSFLDLIAWVVADDRTVPSLKSCSNGCSAVEPCCILGGRGGGKEPAMRFATS